MILLELLSVRIAVPNQQNTYLTGLLIKYSNVRELSCGWQTYFELFESFAYWMSFAYLKFYDQFPTFENW